MVIAWPLIWRSDSAPWARHNAPTSTTGGGGFLLALAVACMLAHLLLRLCDWMSTLRACLRQGPRATAIIRARPMEEFAEGGGKGGRTGTDGIALSACAVSSSSSSFAESSTTSVTVPLAGRARPNIAKLLHSTPIGARVAVGGPPSMVEALDKALREAGRLPSVCLTTQM